MAQSLKNMEGAVAVFGQFTGTTSGNGVTDSPTESLGTLATFRQSFHPWLGYEVNYSYTRFTERYSTIPFGVQNNVNEVTGAYLVQGPIVSWPSAFRRHRLRRPHLSTHHRRRPKIPPAEPRTAAV